MSRLFHWRSAARNVQTQGTPYVLGILPLYALVMFVLCRNWQEYDSRFPLICKVVLISRVHAISWVFSSIGFRIDVGQCLLLLTAWDSISGPQGGMLSVDSARQKTSKTVLASTIWPWNLWIKPRNLATLGFGMLWNSLVSNPCRHKFTTWFKAIFCHVWSKFPAKEIMFEAEFCHCSSTYFS